MSDEAYRSLRDHTGCICIGYTGCDHERRACPNPPGGYVTPNRCVECDERWSAGMEAHHNRMRMYLVREDGTQEALPLDRWWTPKRSSEQS